MSDPECERRAVRSSDPSLSEEANRLLTLELQEIIGREVVDVPVGRGDAADAVHSHRRRVVEVLIAGRFGIGFVLITVACVLAVIGLVWNTPAVLIAAVAVLIAGTLAFRTLFIDLVSETEHPAPETAALLQAEGVGDPDRLLQDLVQEFREPDDHRPRRRERVGVLFDGFVEHELATDRGVIFARIGGNGPPLLLLHGYPQTHLMWHTAAALLADRFTVVTTDLAGYGKSFRPVPAPDHAPHSKRALAADQVQAMAALGHERFAVAGHDRGGRVAYRMALDHPERVSAVAVLDVVPTGEVWARADARLALTYWHWAFLAQPAPLPERLIAGDPDAFFDLHVRALGLGRAPHRYPAELMATYRRLLDDPGTVQAICEDYRAGAGIDRDHDDTDRGRRQIECPLLALWSAPGALPRLYGDVLDVWRLWARKVTGKGLDASHFLVEDRPEEIAEELGAFLEHRAPGLDQP